MLLQLKSNATVLIAAMWKKETGSTKALMSFSLLDLEL
jgi:hypothetical protein